MPDATSIRLAEIPPVVCSSCGGQYTDRRHVDFVASWDGPVLKDVAGGINVSIDELIICEQCIQVAAGFLGLVDPGELAEQLEGLQDRNQELVERLTGAIQYIQKLEAAAQGREDLLELLKPKEAVDGAASR